MGISLLATWLFASQLVWSHNDTNSVLHKIELELKNGSASTSSILMNKNYLEFHQLTEFRELIKKYCRTGPVNIAEGSEPGKKIRVLSTLRDQYGKAVRGAVVYFYQTDAKGWYAADKPHVGGNSGDQRHARLFGYAKTDDTGRFEIHTVRPSGYPQSDLPAHIHVEITSLLGYQPRITEFIFDDDERLVGKVRANSNGEGYILAKPEKTNPPFQQQFSYTITLQKN